VLIFIPAQSHAAESRSSACWRLYWEDASSTNSSAKSSLNDWSCSSQLWHTRRLGCDCLSNACRLWRGVVTTHSCRRATPTVNGRDLTLPTLTQISEQQYNDFTTSNRRSSTPYSRNTPKASHKEPGRMLPRIRRSMCRRLWHTAKISQKFAAVWKFGH